MSGKNEKKRVETQFAMKMPTIKQSVRRCSGEWLNTLAKEGGMYASAAQAEIQRRDKKREKRGL